MNISVKTSGLNPDAKEFTPKSTKPTIPLVYTFVPAADVPPPLPAAKKKKNESKNKNRGDKIYKILVSHIKQEDVEKFIEFVNCTCGKVQFSDFSPKYVQADIPYGFLVLADKAGYTAAIKLDKTKFNDEEIRVINLATTGATVLVLKNLPFEYTVDEFKEFIKTQTVQPLCFNFNVNKDFTFNGIIFIQYLTIHDASQAFNNFYLLKIDNRPIKIEFKKKEEKKIITGWIFLDSKCQVIYNRLHEYYTKVRDFLSGMTSTNPGSLTFNGNCTKIEKECVRMIGHRMDLQVSSESVLGEKKLIVSMIYNRGRSQSMASNISSTTSTTTVNNNTLYSNNNNNNNNNNSKAKRFDKIRHESIERYPIPSTTSTATYQSNLNSDIKNINVIIAKGPDGTNGFKLKRRNSLPDN